jgi:peptidoglycan/LPS O-acetylase OafA/YrhL
LVVGSIPTRPTNQQEPSHFDDDHERLQDEAVRLKSSSGAHFIALDHVRALAAFMVVTWHFTHGKTGTPVPYEYVPSFFPMALLDEGHTGVALFMTLSGYLFAKLLEGRSIDYRAFLWNRALRLLPLLAIVVAIVGITVVPGAQMSRYAWLVAAGAIFPVLPNGGWSITAEFHYYLILPLFLWMLRRSKLLPVSIVLAAIALRSLLHSERGEIQSLAYLTIVGRIDQFALGMLLYQYRAHFARAHALALAVFAAFALYYWFFDLSGGFYRNPSYPSPSPLWIIHTTLEGLAYGIGIAWYEGSFSHPTTGVSRFIGWMGTYSYSIYLLHFFVVFRAAEFVQAHIMDLSNFYVACLWSAVFFLLMMPAGYLSFRFIESPFLRRRKPYIAADPVKA